MKFCAIFLVLSVFTATVAFSYETTKEKASEMGHDTKRAVKNSVREVKDKTCELVNGKMECAVQKAKHTVQRQVDKTEDAID